MSARLPSPVPQGGFQAEIRGASLWDLVQMECLARRRACVRVSAPQDVGYLYFEHGDIVHATTKRLSGQLAALEILSWEQGSFSPVEDEVDRDGPSWPAKRSIDVSHEALILRAAQLRDEALATVLPFPEPEEGGAPLPAGRASSTPPTFVAWAKLDATGRLIEAKGASGDLAPVAAYVARLGELLSENLGLPPLAGLECRFRAEGAEAGGAGGCLVRRTSRGEIVAAQSEGPAEHAALRWSMGFEGG